MNNNSWFKKENPFQTVIGLGGGATGFSVYSSASKTYVDDVFSTDVYEGNETARDINNGIDLSSKGGLVWVKSRNDTHDNHLADTVRGANQILVSNGTAADATLANRITAFNSDGFTLGTAGQVNGTSAYDYSSWTFREQKGFFDIVTYTGNGGGARTINHNLGSVPGFVALKSTSNITNWVCYHKDFSSNEYNSLNSTAISYTDANQSVNSVTSTQFTVGSDQNTNGYTFVVYLWAGGASTASTARSVDMDGTGDYLNTTSSSSDFTMGTGDYTVECWVKADDVTSQGIFDISTTSGGLATSTANQLSVWVAGDDTIKFSAAGAEQTPPIKAQNGVWTHVALARNSGTTSLYVNGTLSKSVADTFNHTGTYIAVGGYYSTTELWDGHISNFRVVKGTAVYTSSFRPPTEPLTNISGTVLLCCNDSSVTGSTVTPVTLNSQGNPTASSDSPFDDPEGFKFGEGGDQNLIKCGSYIGDGSTDGPEIFLGWEPQWILTKSINNSIEKPWCINDVMRGYASNGTLDDYSLFANTSAAEVGFGVGEPTATGYKLRTSDRNWNWSNTTYIYIAIRRPDGYVGKPVEDATKIFAITAGTSNDDIPTFVSGHPTDFTLFKQFAGTDPWYSQARITGTGYMLPASNSAESTSANNTWDFMNGYYKATGDWSAFINWMWKRHAGFDVVTYDGDGVPGHQISHSLSKTPEMIWIKRRTNGTADWVVGHKGSNGGTNPWHYGLRLNDTATEDDLETYFNDTAPTATHFTLGSHNWVNNGSSRTYMAMLFASVEGISKCGYYDGSDSVNTITTGFQPRFLIIKATTSAQSWFVLDTTRGWTGSGTDKGLKLNYNNAQTDYDRGAPTSTGFTLTVDSAWNASGIKYVYYAHA